MQYFLEYYRDHKLDFTHLYDGITDALTAHMGPRQMAVLTNKPVIPSRAIVEALGLAGFFVSVYGGNSFPTKKPDPQGLLRILRRRVCRGRERDDRRFVDRYRDRAECWAVDMWRDLRFCAAHPGRCQAGRGG